MRIGQGYDVHRLVEGRELWLCGIKLEHTLGLLGHSDADVAIHALCDAILGALALRVGRSRFDGDIADLASEYIGEFFAHLFDVGIDFRTFGADSDVHVPYGVPFVGHHAAHLREQKFAVGSLVSRVGVGKMISDVTECQGTEYRIAECVYRHIAICLQLQ